MYKQVIVVNKGLKMSPGKLGAMVAHVLPHSFVNGLKEMLPLQMRLAMIIQSVQTRELIKNFSLSGSAAVLLKLYLK